MPHDDSISLTRAVGLAYASGDWARLRAAYHDDALLCTLAAQEEILPPDELIDVFARVSEENTYDVVQTSISAIDEVACIVTGKVRYPIDGRGFGDGHRAWVLTYKDGLLYRSCAYPSVRRAREAYAVHGIDLGITQRTQVTSGSAARPDNTATVSSV